MKATPKNARTQAPVGATSAGVTTTRGIWRLCGTVMLAAGATAVSAWSTGALAGETTLVSVNSAGNQDQGHDISAHVLSADGRFVAFVAPTSLVTGTSGHWGVLVRDRVLGTTAVISMDSAGMLANATSQSPALSADGRYVAFQSHANNLVAGDTNRYADIFVHDRQTGVTTRISVDSAGTQANNESESPAISADGRYVAFVSWASNLIPSDTNPQRDVFVHDRATGKTTRVSVDSAGLEANHQSTSPTLSADGRYVAFVTRADNLAPGIPYSYGVVDFVVVHDRQSHETTLASMSSAGIAGEGLQPSLSADGRYVAFSSHASNLVAGDTNNNTDIFVHDQQTGVTTRESVDSTSLEANHQSTFPTLSADGRYVAFQSQAINLVAGDTNLAGDVFVRDRLTGETTRVSVGPAGIQASGSSGTSGIGTPVSPAISADGRYVTFASSAANLVAGDTNGNVDIFIHDRGAAAPETDPPVRKETQLEIGPEPPTQRAIVITHGWNSDVDTWVKEMADMLCDLDGPLPGAKTVDQPITRAVAHNLWRRCQKGAWDVYVADWRSGAGWLLSPPWLAYAHADDVGQRLAAALMPMGYQHLHFIAHSAGSNVIDNATIAIKAAQGAGAPTIHETFLDAYDPFYDASRYGLLADWADSYVDTRDFKSTALVLKHAHTVDVTPGLFENCGLFDVHPICFHSRPYRFYGYSIDTLYAGDEDYATHDQVTGSAGVGYALSLEKGLAPSVLHTEYPKGDRCTVDQSSNICVPGASLPPMSVVLSPSFAETFVEGVSGAIEIIACAGDKIFCIIKAGLAFASPLLTPQSALVQAAAVEDTTEPPAWFTASVTTQEPANTLRFNWRFASGGEGFVRIFVDDQLVREMDQRHLPLASLTPEEVYVGDLEPGTHKLAIRLDGFGKNPSGFEMTDVQLGKLVSLPDTDADGVADISDNCTQVANANQRDTNGDGYGNLCDADLNNNGIVNTQDLVVFKAAFGSIGTNLDADFNGDGVVNTKDLTIFKAFFGKVPGPSGVAP